MFGTDRNAMRQVFFDAWQQARAGAILDPGTRRVADVIGLHPEYHGLLDDREAHHDRDYTPEDGQTNPFLHMAMHIGLREQLSTDRPAGIVAIHSRLSDRLGDVHDAEHHMMECLGQALWEAQSAGRMPDETAYLECLRRL
ncbi:MAG: DUF1841 family protein [Pseudomonadota bacterium]